MSIHAPTLPKAFVWRRLHSFTGLWLVGFLIIHLVSNSQAALFFGDDGSGFISAANSIKGLPYLPAIEIGLLAVPFFIHIWWGIQYLLTGKFNSYRTDGTRPSLPEYPRNHAYTWQRITSWILLVLIVAHVIQMRFLEEPIMAQKGSEKDYMVRVNSDPGIYSLSERLGVTLYDAAQIEQQRKLLVTKPPTLEDNQAALIKAQEEVQQREWVAALEERPLRESQLIAVSKNFGTAELLMLRETFKIPIMIVLYTVLVISACFHAFNGLWTFCITWGITLSPSAQNGMRYIATLFMFLIGFLGLAAVWGTYWINLKT